jgi:hypothetical protein
MTLYNFITADEQEQAEAAWDGVHVATRDDGVHKILLYQINEMESFYVEVYYHKEDNSIRKLRPFKSTELLDLYAHEINVRKLLTGIRTWAG